MTGAASPPSFGDETFEILEDTTHLKWIAVDDEYRRQGLAQRLLMEGVAVVERLGKQAIVTDLASDNPYSRALDRWCGSSNHRIAVVGRVSRSACSEKSAGAAPDARALHPSFRIATPWAPSLPFQVALSLHSGWFICSLHPSLKGP
jgi:GNAT superfamily N-acetyltransferase